MGAAEGGRSGRRTERASPGLTPVLTPCERTCPAPLRRRLYCCLLSLSSPAATLGEDVAAIEQALRPLEPAGGAGAAGRGRAPALRGCASQGCPNPQGGGEREAFGLARATPGAAAAAQHIHKRHAPAAPAHCDEAPSAWEPCMHCRGAVAPDRHLTAAGARWPPACRRQPGAPRLQRFALTLRRRTSACPGV